MKSIVLLSSLAIAVSPALAAPNEPAAPSSPAPITKPAATISSHVTVTIESGGKKETHEIDLGNAPTLKIEGGTLILNDAPSKGIEIKGKTEKAGGGSDAGTTLAAKSLTTIAPGSLQISSASLQISSAPTPWLGVTIDEISEEVRAQLPIEPGAGLVVRNVVPDGPAAQAGLQKNDVLAKLDDQLLVNGNQLSALVQMKKDGDKVRLTYFRGGKSATTEAQIRMHQEANAGKTILNALGALGEMVMVDKDGHVLVTRTQPDLSAVTAQIEKILRAAGVDDKTITETEGAIADAAKAASSAVSSISNEDGGVARQLKDAADQVAKSLEKARAAAEHAREQAQESRDRLEKQGDSKKTPAAQ
jgi:hypothetical protein